MKKQRFTLGNIFAMRESVLILLIIVGGLIIAVVTPNFLNISNLQALLVGLSTESLIAAGMAILLVSGGLDLSVGSTVTFIGVVTGLCITNGIPVIVSAIIGLLTGMVIGLVNGIIIARFNNNAFIITLGMMQIVRGLALLLGGGTGIVGFPEAFLAIGQGKLLGFQYPIFYTLVAVVVLDFLLRRSKFLRQSFYVGGNEKSALVSGINVVRTKLANYVLVSFLAAAAGIIICSRLGNASVNVGVGMEMKVITACVIGGASLSGGEGSVFGAFWGSLLTAMVINALNMLGANVYWQNVFTGAVLIFAVCIDTAMKIRRGETSGF